ncbi:hypothetical protein [Parendozoicomonas sp. Alg238-R29]|uniref:hypothetical protein n=1 Tax=Parendozoicomonas sp. Alg238-R29 TaxID=2993446 RepID=UPI00248EE4CC|nr:hypothetical protein [Parendozoicomonas sp. Alg238-R29]
MRPLTATLKSFLPYITGQQEARSFSLPGVPFSNVRLAPLDFTQCNHCLDRRIVAKLPCGHNLCSICVEGRTSSENKEDILCPCSQSIVPYRVRLCFCLAGLFTSKLAYLSASEKVLLDSLLQAVRSTDEEERSEALNRAYSIVVCKGKKIDLEAWHFGLDRENPVSLFHLAVFSNDTELVKAMMYHSGVLLGDGYADLLPWFYRNHPMGERAGPNSTVLPMIELLVQNGVVNCKDNGSSLFRLALEAADTKVLQFLIESNATPDPLNWEYAFLAPNAEILELLIKEGISCEEVNALGETALHNVIRTQKSPSNIEMIKVFIKYDKGNFLAINDRGETLLDMAIERWDRGLICTLLARHTTQQWLEASRKDSSVNKLATQAYCLKKGKSLDITKNLIDGWVKNSGHSAQSLARLPYDDTNETLFELACRIGNTEIIEVLTGYGCSLFTAEDGRRPPIDIWYQSRAKISENETIELLSWLTSKRYFQQNFDERGSRVNWPVDEHHNTLLSLAVQAGYKRAVSHLIASGADPYVTNSYGKKPIDYVSDDVRRDIKILLVYPNWAFLQSSHSRKRPGLTLESAPAPKRTREICLVM